MRMGADVTATGRAARGRGARLGSMKSIEIEIDASRNRIVELTAELRGSVPGSETGSSTSSCHTPPLAWP